MDPSHSELEDRQPLILNDSASVNTPDPIPAPYRAYIRRWFVLVVFVMLAMSQRGLWNTWGPIADTAKAVFDWNDSDIALLTNWGCITFVASAFFYSWLMDVKGLKLSLVIGAASLFIGTGIRCIPVPVQYIKWTMHTGQIMIGFAGPVMMAGPTLLSATWFPPKQRITATAISISVPYLGPAMAYLIGPAFVSEVHHSNPNNSLINDIDPKERQHHIDEIFLLMYVEFGAMAVLLLVLLYHFPSKPPSPPSASADHERENFKAGLLKLVKNIHFWLIALCYSLSNGLFYAWQSQLVIIFKATQNVGEDWIELLWLYVGIAAVVGAIIFGRLIEHVGHEKMKPFLIGLAICGTGFSVWTVLLCLDQIHFNIAFLYASCIAFGFCVYAMVPMLFELTIEGMYPVAECIITGFMTWLVNLVCLIALIVIMVWPNIDSSWLNYATLAGVAIGLPLLSLYKEEYNRMKFDTDTLNASKKGKSDLQVIHATISEATVYLCQFLDPAELLRPMESRGALSHDDVTEIRSHVIVTDRVDKLMEILKRKPASSYQTFMALLKEQRNDLYDEVKSIYEKHQNLV